MGTRTNQNLSTRLYIQAALTAVFAPVNPGGKGFLVVTFLLAAGAAILGAWVRTGPPQTRTATIAFEAVAVLIGVIGLVHHSYVPGTIIGIATLIAVLNGTPAVATPSAVAPPSAVAAQPFAPAQPWAAQPAYAAQPFAPQPQGVAPGFTAGHQQSFAPAMASAPAGQWAADPTGRHHYRWWDGQTWTAHVSDNGVTALDPI